MFFLKKFIPTLVIFHTAALLTSAPETCPIFISLGKDCEPSWNMQHCNLRKSAYPFDWIITSQFRDVCSLIENQFHDFLNPTFLKWNKVTVAHTKYTIQFRHDFPSNTSGPHYTVSGEPGTDNAYEFYNGLTVENFLDYLDAVAEKYARRINRLYSHLNTASTIVFLRTDIKPEEAVQFTQLMATKYPHVTYTLLVLNKDPRLDYDWNIPHVQNYYRERSHPQHSHWVHPEEWKKLFIQLGFGKWMVHSKKTIPSYPYIHEHESVKNNIHDTFINDCHKTIEHLL